MKHLVATVALIGVVAATTGFVSFRTSGDPAVQSALSKQDAMEWLRTDFQLTDAQFAAIKKLHDSYSIVCEEHCRQIQEATRTRNSLKTANADASALAVADRRVEELRLVCESAIATHVRECATHMSPDAGQRYLAMVLPKIKDFDHVAAPSVQLNHGRH
jgi:hypothetical protein